jgi:thiamine biosynthesis lipoprotein
MAMGSPCEVLTRVGKASLARSLCEAVASEAWRVEDKFSRYRAGNIIDRINQSRGEPIEVDDETANLLDFADALHGMSDGLFDVTSGVLRKAWTFDGGQGVPTQSLIESLLPKIGWRKANWKRPMLALRPGMQIDFGGIGKEYAVDQAARVAASTTRASTLVNFGGDIFVHRDPDDSRSWQVGIEALEGRGRQADRVIRLGEGALATSGDARRFVLHDGIRYGHILNPMTGWPVAKAPRSITVAAPTCTQAGMLATLAMLRGDSAEAFLDEQDVQYWCAR